MAQGMCFLRECVGDKLILGCGVPLASAFGRVDYCRIGCDIALSWDEPWYMKALHRERVSTPRAIRNTIGRRQLDGRAFLNDPDVFILRNERNSLTNGQRELIYFINCLFGSLVFTSDNVGEYEPMAQKLFSDMDRAMERELLQMRLHGPDVVELRYREGTLEHWAAINMRDAEIELNPCLVDGTERIAIPPFKVIIR